jgi:ring-1,2-phenylacetyl-CoA epoxidase subunit PaaC
MQTAIDALWMYTGEMFQPDAVDEVLEAQGTVSDVAGLREPWLAQLRHTLAEATLKLPAPDAWMQKGGKQGRHGEHLGFLLAEMQFLQRAYPGAQW